MDWMYRVAATAFLCLVPHLSFSADSGLITKESKHSVSETAQRFESAVNDKSATGWMVFTEIDHAAAAEKNGLKRSGESLADLQFSRVHSGLRLPPPWAAVESGCRKSNGQCVG